MFCRANWGSVGSPRYQLADGAKLLVDHKIQYLRLNWEGYRLVVTMEDVNEGLVEILNLLH